MKNTQWVKETIQVNFKTFPVNHIVKLGEGWMSQAYLVNNEFVFRFPKNKEGAYDTKKEIKILPELKNPISLAIPDLKYIGVQKNGYPFVGYPILPGEPLYEQNFHTLTDAIKKYMAHQLARFMDELQDFDIERAIEFSVPEKNLFQYYSELFNEVQHTIYPYLEDEINNYISTQFKTYLNNKENFIYQPRLLHGDLSCDHLLFDQEQEVLRSIIDFGDLHVGDPDFEYIYLLEECGEAFTTEVMKERREKNVPFKIEKVHLLLTIETVRLLLEAHNMNKRNFVEESIAFIETEMKREK